MRKALYLSLAAAAVLLAACTKDLDRPDLREGTVLMTLQASVDESTRIAYADGKTFTWCAGDKIAVRLSDGQGDAGWVHFSTEESGPSVRFSAEVPAGYTPTGLAFYSLLSIERDANEYADDIDGVSYGYLYYYYPQLEGTDRLNLVPLIGTLEEETQDGFSFSFHTAVGLVKIPLVNVPDDVYAVRLSSNGTAICGAFPITDKGYFATEDVLQGYEMTELSILPIVEDGQAVVYFPLPVGTLPAGSTLSFLDENEMEMASKTTTKDVEIQRNGIVQFPEMDLGALLEENPWKNLGDARMFDSFFGLDYAHFESVPIQQLKQDPHVYRLLNPYGTMFGTEKADPYLTFTIHDAGEVLSNDGSVVSSHYGIVTFEPHMTGMTYPFTNNSGEQVLGDVWLRSLSLYTGVTENDFYYSIVIAQDAEGNPTHIQLAPVYYYGGGSFWYYYYNDMIQIAMPGYDPIESPFWVSVYWDAPLTIENGEAKLRYTTHGGIDYFKVAVSKSSPQDAYALLSTDQAIYIDPTQQLEGELSVPVASGSGIYYVAVRGFHYGYLFNSFDFEMTVPAETATEGYLHWVGTWQADNGETWTILDTEDYLHYLALGLFGLENYGIPAIYDEESGNLVFTTQSNYTFYGLYYENNTLYYWPSNTTIFSVAPDGTVTPGRPSSDKSAFVQYYLHNGNYNYPLSDIPTTLTRVSQ